ncbi:putative nucleic acid binding protein 23 [Elsinoe australis]|uniref:Putative nucleic acid binding protein 23 n=1 Tax=Elsinoe australis TaxID=40998 RepID=A0A4U7AUM0_9PEZI|nr:putative nucleic acid binding protein 23 [Elsinoe australis]
MTEPLLPYLSTTLAYLYAYLLIYLFAYLSAILIACSFAYLYAYLFAYHFAYIFACLSTHLSACHPAYLLASSLIHEHSAIASPQKALTNPSQDPVISFLDLTTLPAPHLTSLAPPSHHQPLISPTKGRYVPSPPSPPAAHPSNTAFLPTARDYLLPNLSSPTEVDPPPTSSLRLSPPLAPLDPGPRLQATAVVAATTRKTHRCPVPGCKSAFTREYSIKRHVNERHHGWRCEWKGGPILERVAMGEQWTLEGGDGSSVGGGSLGGGVHGDGIHGDGGSMLRTTFMTGQGDTTSDVDDKEMPRDNTTTDDA